MLPDKPLRVPLMRGVKPSWLILDFHRHSFGIEVNLCSWLWWEKIFPNEKIMFSDLVFYLNIWKLVYINNQYLTKNKTAQLYFILGRARVYLNFFFSSMPNDSSDILIFIDFTMVSGFLSMCIAGNLWISEAPLAKPDKFHSLLL